jgi:hypothetical protein
MPGPDRRPPLPPPGAPRGSGFSGRRNPPRNRFIVQPSPVAWAESPPPHDRLDSELATFVLRLEIETLSPLFTGAGYFEIADNKAVKTPLQRSGRSVVAGSSIKGACRQLHEVLTASGDPFRNGGGASASLFGALSLAGRLSFDDAVHAGELPDGAPPEPHSPARPLERVHLSTAYPPGKDAPKGRRFYGLQPAGADQPARIVAMAFPAGTYLATLLRLENVDRVDVGSILVALGMAPELAFTPRLGGGKYDTFGWVRFHLRGYRRWRGLGRSDPWETNRGAIEAFRDEQAAKFLATSPAGLPLFRSEIVAKLQGPDGGRR